MDGQSKQPDSNSQPKKRGGRRPGQRNKATLEIQAAAKVYAGDAIRALVYVARKGKSEAARVSAATVLLERGYGRPRQSVEMSGPNGQPIQVADPNAVRERFDRRITGLAARLVPGGSVGEPHHNGDGGA